jgi:hypothetical protein
MGLIILGFFGTGYGLPTIDGKRVGFYPITNEVSFYQNVDDSGNDRGRTLQIVSINTIKILTDFNFELAADFNFEMSNFKRDHYLELGIVKSFGYGFSLNYQRVISKFEPESINQFGVRYSF